ncbi:MAG: glucosyl-3-phosphoglycerate synthase [Luteolibacter sp.]
MPTTFHCHQFADARALLKLKNEPITVCIPTLNEAETIGPIVETLRRELMLDVPLVDELLVIDSGSTDATRDLAASAGATVHLASDIAPEHGHHRGKGENLWKSLHASTGRIVCFIDGDIADFHSGFVTGLIGPLLHHPEIDYVKAFYERPLLQDDGTHTSGGGRVSEILIRPLLSLFYPELSAIYQPLSGEYAARRTLLETLPFPVGYGVEIAHLIDLHHTGRLPHLAQTDLVRRVHRNRHDAELGQMAFSLLQVIFRRLERDRKLSLATSLPTLFQAWAFENEIPTRIRKNLPEPERPPLIALPIPS